MTARRPDGLTAGIILLVLAVWPPGRLAAQVAVRAGVGARFSTALVNDSIVVPVALKPGLAPALQLTVRDELKGPWAGDLTVDLSPSQLKREESGTTSDAGSATMMAITLGLHREVYPGVAARLGVGGLLYLSDNAGVFNQGSGGLFPLVGLGASYAPTFGARYSFQIGLSYDVHRFITPALRSVGFNDPQPVHRIALTVSGRLLGGGR